MMKEARAGGPAIRQPTGAENVQGVIHAFGGKVKPAVRLSLNAQILS
jgi:hypothetical protein